MNVLCQISAMFSKQHILAVFLVVFLLPSSLAKEKEIADTIEEKIDSKNNIHVNEGHGKQDHQERKVIDDVNQEEIHSVQTNTEIKQTNDLKEHQEKEANEKDALKQQSADVRETPDIEQDVVSQESESKKNAENDEKKSGTEEEPTQSFFSFKSFVKNLVNPVLEELEKGNKGDKSNVKVVNEVSLNESLSSNVTNDSVPLAAEIRNKTDKRSKFTCTGRNYTLENSSVMIVNNTQLLSILSFDKNNTEGDCVLVLFFVPYCRFCAAIAPSFNALARVYPQLNIIAVDAAQFSNLNAKFGTVSVPNIALFHQSRAVVRFNSTEKTFANLVSFVKNSTGFEPNQTEAVTPEDLIGPLASVATETTDYMLLMSWLFVIFCSGFMFVQSSLGQQWINKVNLLWQEHQHID